MEYRNTILNTYLNIEKKMHFLFLFAVLHRKVLQWRTLSFCWHEKKWNKTEVKWRVENNYSYCCCNSAMHEWSRLSFRCFSIICINNRQTYEIYSRNHIKKKSENMLYSIYKTTNYIFWYNESHLDWTYYNIHQFV